MFLVAVAVYALGWFIMARTAFGQRVYSVSANPVVARLAGINVAGVKLASFAVVGRCVSIAVVLNAARIGAVSPNSGQGLKFEVTAAEVIRRAEARRVSQPRAKAARMNSSILHMARTPKISRFSAMNADFARCPAADACNRDGRFRGEVCYRPFLGCPVPP